MDYQQSLDYVTHARQAGAAKHGLANITGLLKRLGNPEARFQSVHVAGTNGKGSVCALLESTLRHAGYRTGLYTSPYLERFPERIRVGGAEIGEEEFAALATRVRAAADGMVREGLAHPTFFELVTACGFLHFAETSVDVAVVETGLGGRTDATNVLRPALSVITRIGVDHAESLGGSLESISREKAGIVKPGVPCVLSAGNDPGVVEIIRQAAALAGSPLLEADQCVVECVRDGFDGQAFHFGYGKKKLERLEIRLLGRHQLYNAASAILAALKLNELGYDLPETGIRAGLSAARWPGRMELLRLDPPLLIDGAHNPQGAEALAETVRNYLPGRPVCLVIGAMACKDAAGMAHSCASFATKVIATMPPSCGRPCHDPEELARLFRGYGVPAVCSPDWKHALEQALENGTAIVVAGSLYLAGAARSWLRSVAGAVFGG